MNLIVQEMVYLSKSCTLEYKKPDAKPLQGSNRVDGFLALQGPLDKSDSDDRISATTSTPCLKNTIVTIDANNNEATGKLIPSLYEFNVNG